MLQQLKESKKKIKCSPKDQVRLTVHMVIKDAACLHYLCISYFHIKIMSKYIFRN